MCFGQLRVFPRENESRGAPAPKPPEMGLGHSENRDYMAPVCPRKTVRPECPEIPRTPGGRDWASGIVWVEGSAGCLRPLSDVAKPCISSTFTWTAGTSSTPHLRRPPRGRVACGHGRPWLASASLWIRLLAACSGPVVAVIRALWTFGCCPHK